MTETVIQIKHLGKRYRLGVMGSKRLVDDVNRQWARLRGTGDNSFFVWQWISIGLMEKAAEIASNSKAAVRS